nr:outer membrane beta-barrel protein [Rheinheimera maricola]
MLTHPVCAQNAANKTAAAEHFSISAAANYSRVEHATNKSKGGGYEANLGYSINSNWSIELGYLDALDKTSTEPDYDSGSLYGNGYQLKGAMLTVLGKAAMAEGELYYRAGILRAEINATTFYNGEPQGFTCHNGLISEYEVTWDDIEYNFFKCEASAKKNVALFGLGYKYNISDSWFLSTEVRRIFARSGFNVDNVSVGIGYRF